MNYPIEHFSPAERTVLDRYFTTLDGPVFALVNLPETVKGALFARYSRYGGTLRRLFLDEFASTLPSGSAPNQIDEGARAAKLYDNVFVGFGDDSIAQLGGAHVACEWCSNVLTKILQRPRIASYLEQSTRYIAYDEPLSGDRFRYYTSPELGSAYDNAMSELFRIYSKMLRDLLVWLEDAFPAANGEPPAARKRAIRAKALDTIRGLLPASTLSHVGIYASGQAYEQLVLHLLAHPLPEAQQYGKMLLSALNHVIPSFMKRVERPDRGGAWQAFLAARLAASEETAQRYGLRAPAAAESSSVQMTRHEGTEKDLLAALLFESSSASELDVRTWVDDLGADLRTGLIAELAGSRSNRRHRPGRGFEALRYRFEIVSDYGAFRDLQRHRMLTAQWQALSPDLGADIPEEVVAAGLADEYARALEVSHRAYVDLVDGGLRDQASYAVCLGFKIRYILDVNAREAMHIIELRSERQGHPSYRKIAQEMYRQIAAVHPAVAEAMQYVDLDEEPRLERLSAEIRHESALVAHAA
jgi:thymidylate synthase ThyX